jgi:hypothetical protein
MYFIFAQLETIPTEWVRYLFDVSVPLEHGSVMEVLGERTLQITQWVLGFVHYSVNGAQSFIRSLWSFMWSRNALPFTDPESCKI